MIRLEWAEDVVTANHLPLVEHGEMVATGEMTAEAEATGDAVMRENAIRCYELPNERMR